MIRNLIFFNFTVVSLVERILKIHIILIIVFLGFIPVFSKAQMGNALDFDGINDYIIIPNSATLNQTNLTISAWFYLNDVTGYHDIVSKPAASTWIAPYARYNIRTNGPKIEFWTEDYSARLLVSVSNIVAGIWYHIACTYDGTTQKIYINGVLDNSNVRPGSISSSIYDLIVGRCHTAFNTYFNGRIDELRIWNIAQSQAQIQADMYTYITPAHSQWSNLKAYYRFDQGDAGNNNAGRISVMDYSDNCNIGILNGPFALTGSVSNWVFPGNAEAPILTTTAASGIAETTVTLNGNIFSIGETAVTTRGFCYSTYDCPTTASPILNESGSFGAGTYSLGATGLTGGTTYFARAYSINSKGTSYGETISFLTLPAAPTAIAETNIATTTFSSNWNVSTGASGYRLDVATDVGFTSFVTGYNNLNVANVTTYSVSGLSPGTNYYYRVRAYNASGTGINSNIISLITIPTTQTATAASSITTTGFSSNWNATIGASGYRLDVATDAGFTSFVAGYNNLDVGNVITYAVSGLSPGTNYYYRVRAYNAGGTSSNSNTITLITFPAAPVSIAATAVSTTTFTANWNTTTGASGYRLDLSTDAGFTSFVTGYNDRNVFNFTTFNISGLSANTSYYYRVRAYNASGTGANSNIISQLTAPVAPVAIAATNIISTSFSINWNASIGATGYMVDVATDAGFTSFLPGFNNIDVSNVTTYSVVTSTCGNTYYFRVRAYNTGGESGNSNSIIITHVIPTITGTTPGKRAGVGAVMLKATASTGSINWYDAATGGTTLHTGPTFITPYLYVPETYYYVDATSTSGCITGVRTAILATANTITFDVIPSKYVTDVPFTLNATASSGLPITYSITAGGTVASVLGNVVTLTGLTGQVSIKATQAGDADFAQANLTRIFTVSKLANSVTLSSIPIKYTTDPNFFVTANATNGTVGFSSSNSSVATINSTTGEVIIIGAGSTTIIVSVPASPIYLACSASRTLTVNKSPNTVTLATIPAKYVDDANFIVSATATAGTISYSSSNPTVATINSVTGEIDILSSGSTTIKASVPASTEYLAGTASKTLTVSKRANPVTLATIPSKYVDDSNFTVSATALDGTIEYTSSNPAVATINSSTGEVDILSAGSTVIKASVPVSSIYLAGSSTKTLTVNKRTNSITIAAIPIKYVDDANFTVSATAINGTIEYTSSNPAVATINSVTGEVDILSAGSTIIKASVPVSSVYLAGMATKTLTVKKRTNIVTLATIPSKYVDEANFIVSATALDGTIVYTSSNPAVATINSVTGEIDILSAGSTVIKASVPTSAIYLAGSASKTLTVSRRVNTVTLASIPIKYSNDANFIVTATALNGTIEYTSSNPAVATINSVTGEVTILSAGSTTIKASVPISAVYLAGSVSRSLRVYAAPIVSDPIDISENVNGTNKIISDIENAEISKNVNFEVYPNPSNTGIFNLSLFGDFNKNSIISVCDLTGKIVFENKIRDEQTLIDLNGFANGVYILVIKNDKQTFSKRIVISGK